MAMADERSRNWGRALLAGWVGGFAGNALLGTAFSSQWAQNALYNPSLQSPLFLEITPQRDILVSVAGLVCLSGIHGLLYHILESAIPGGIWWRKGLCWGIALWALFWLFQEWFIYMTLFGEPWLLAMLELLILLMGSLLEGVVIAGLVPGRSKTTSSK